MNTPTEATPSVDVEALIKDIQDTRLRTNDGPERDLFTRALEALSLPKGEVAVEAATAHILALAHGDAGGWRPEPITMDQIFSVLAPNSRPWSNAYQTAKEHAAKIHVLLYPSPPEGAPR